MTDLTTAEPHEALAVSVVRSIIRHWPLPRGRGVLLRAAKAALGDRSRLLKIADGVFVEGRLDDYATVYYFVHGYRNDPAFTLAFSLIEAGDVVFDIGANKGWFAIPAARRVGSDGRVEAFEPDPVTYGMLVRNLQLNRLVSVRAHALAVAEEEGRRAFQTVPANSVRGSLAPALSDETIEVDATTIDAHCQRHGLGRIDWLKIDVEGAEHLVVAGARRMLSAPTAPALLFEVGEELAERFGSSSPRVKRLLGEFGYRFFALQGGRLRSVSVEARHPGSADLFAFTARHLDTKPGLASLLERR